MQHRKRRLYARDGNSPNATANQWVYRSPRELVSDGTYIEPFVGTRTPGRLTPWLAMTAAAGRLDAEPLARLEPADRLRWQLLTVEQVSPRRSVLAPVGARGAMPAA